MPRGGERRAPNPVFLAHAAALTELYVAIYTTARAAGFVGFRYEREGEAREVFQDGMRERVLAPDATILLVDKQDRRFTAFVEIDRGTMSHARLRQKAELYVAYAAADAWRKHHQFLPALLFLTSTDIRAHKFMRALAGALSFGPRQQRRHAFVAGASGTWAPHRLLDGPCLIDLDGTSGLTLLDVLNTAREPYEEARAYRQEQREAEEEQRRRLREEPEAMRAHLRHSERSLGSYYQALGPAGAQALKLLLASHDEPLPEEREVLRAIAHDLDEALCEPDMSAISTPGPAVQGEVTLLVDSYRVAQREQLKALSGRYGEGPRLREARARLRSGALIEHRMLSTLPAKAKRDAAGREEQHKRRLAYLEWRKGAARQRARKAGPLGRLTHRAEDFYEPVDRRWLRVCRRCDEIVYRAVSASGGLEDKPSCHYCHSTERVTAYRKDDRTDQEGEMYL